MAKNYKTLALTGTEQKVVLAGQNCDIRNDSTDIVYASAEAGITSGADGVLSIPAGQAAKLLDCRGVLHILGTGSVMMCGNDYSELVFKSAASASGGGGVDDVARTAISTHAADGDIHLTAEKAAEAAASVTSNPNLLINPCLDINQRGAAEYSALTKIGYCVDGWICRGNSMVIPVDGCVKIACGEESTSVHSFITQTIENGAKLAGETVTYSVYVSEMTAPRGMISVWTGDGVAEPVAVNFAAYTAAGRVTVTADIPDTAKLVMVRIDGARAGAAVGDYSIISGAKLELGSYATAFGIPDPAAELARCQRYYQVRSTGDINPVDLRPSMAEITDVKQREDGAFEYVAEL